MPIVDAQIHIWGKGLPSNAAHWQITSFPAARAIEMMDEAGVDAAVIHPPSWDADSTALAIDAVKRWPGRFAIMDAIPLDAPDVRERIARLRAGPGMLGLRYMFLKEPERTWIEDGTIDWLWAACEKAAIAVAALATDSLKALGRIAERHPGLRITVDHMGGRGGNTTLKDHAAMTHMPELVALARYPNVGVKVTGAPGYSAETYPFPIMQGYVRQIFDAFGPERTFWGTDISKMPCSWKQCIRMFTEHMPWMSDADRRLVMGDAICKWWGWQR
jgi:predicted TIM-barrel fold metal-dependent hydrolase